MNAGAILLALMLAGCVPATQRSAPWIIERPLSSTERPPVERVYPQQADRSRAPERPPIAAAQ